jgi:cytoskeletal protein CcmA (bactofilin family)
MPPFGQKKGEAEGVTAVVPSPENQSLLTGKTLLIKGEVISEDDVLIDGRLEGKINVKNRVTIGKNAVIRADIEARDVVIRGRVAGDIHAVGQVEIVAEGNLHGNIVSPKIIIADGAVFEGNIDMKAREEAQGQSAEDKSNKPKPFFQKDPDDSAGQGRKH